MLGKLPQRKYAIKLKTFGGGEDYTNSVIGFSKMDAVRKFMEDYRLATWNEYDLLPYIRLESKEII